MNMTPALDQQTKYQKIQNIAFEIIVQLLINLWSIKLLLPDMSYGHL